jgi:ClpP class serine protease
VYVEEGTTLVGSIGVVQRHVDISAAEAQQGQRTTEITAGRYKRIASNYAPLTEEGRATIQAQVDYVYSLFVEAVAVHRGVSADRVLQDMADGRVFVGEQAIAAGLVDGVATLDQLIEKLNRERSSGSSRSARATAAIPQPPTGARMPLTRDQLSAEAPELLQALLAEGNQAGAAAERERIKSVQAQAMPGHDKLISELMFDGKTSGPEAAVAVLQAEKALRGTAATNLAADAPAPVAAAATPLIEAAAQDPADDKSLPLEERCKAKWDKSPELRSEFANLAAFTAFSKAAERGAARIFSRKEA